MKNINEKSNRNFVWVKHVIKIVGDDGKVTPCIVIGKQDLETGLFLVSPYSDFPSSIKNKKTTTQIAYANVVVPFLNFLYDKDSAFDIDSITVQDGVDFLTSCNVNPKTKQRYAYYLQTFYRFLAEHDIHFLDFDYQKMDVFNMPIFEGKYRQSKDRDNKDVLHNLKPEYLPLFLTTAIEIVPEIALGVYLGCFGGLRNSEIVSIEYKDIRFRYQEDGTIYMTVNLADKDLRPDAEYGFIAQVKKKRKQEVIPVYGNLLKHLYDRHKENCKKGNEKAVFIDEKGLPMTAQTYANKFKKLKKAFISKLENSSSIEARAYAITLKTYKWKTHICRGVFSNIVAENTNSIGEIALWRGDSSYTSALAYLNDKNSIGDDVIKVLDELYTGKGEV